MDGVSDALAVRRLRRLRRALRAVYALMQPSGTTKARAFCVGESPRERGAAFLKDSLSLGQPVNGPIVLIVQYFF